MREADISRKTKLSLTKVREIWMNQIVKIAFSQKNSINLRESYL